MADGSSQSEGSPGATGGSGSLPAVPDHVLLRRIGKGSYGEIWLARCALGACRAVKVVYRRNFSDTRPYEREFSGIKRFEPVSREHEGLVDILQVGRNDEEGFFYYVMELADDAAGGSGGRAAGPQPSRPPEDQDRGAYLPRTLGHEIRSRGPLPAVEVMRIGATLAEGLDYLHSKGLVHRDIKPSNIIFVGGKPKLADVGLVAELGDPQSLVGTVGFMAPEGPGTVQADIFSLGKVMYEALTGKDRQEFPELPTRLGTDGGEAAFLELNEVVLRACAREPRDRYPTARELLADLTLLQEGKSLRRVRQRRRRLRRMAAVAAVVLGAGALAWLSQSLKRLNAAEVLLSEGFDGPRINPNRWTFGQKEWPGIGNTGHRQLRVEQTNGELVIEASAQHEHGLSTFGAAWADLNQDLRQWPECRLELELAATNRSACVTLSISDGSQPQDPNDSAAVRLIKNVRPWDHDRVRIDILPKHQAAVAYPDALIEDQYDILDLSRLKTWRLRCYAAVSSSTTVTNGLASLGVRQVTVVRQPPARTVIGHVINELTGHPVAGAIIKDEHNTRLAKSLENGAFKLGVDPGPRWIRAEHGAFAASEPIALSASRPERDPLEIPLHKDAYAFGDVTDVIRYTNFEAGCIGFRGTNLWIIGRSVPTNFVLMPVDLKSKRLIPPGISLGPHDQGFGPPVQCGSRLLTTSPFPRPMIYDLTAGKPRELLVPLHPLDGKPLLWVTTAAYDGQYLWLLATDNPRDRVGLHAFDLKAGKVVRWMPSADKNIFGLAWDPARRQFWISTLDDRVYAVDRERAFSQGRVESGRGREFRGNYESIAFSNGSLWGLDRDKQRICKIKLAD